MVVSHGFVVLTIVRLFRHQKFEHNPPSRTATMPTIRDRPPGWVPGPAVDDITREEPLSESDEGEEDEDSASHWWHNFGEEAGDEFDHDKEDEPLVCLPVAILVLLVPTLAPMQWHLASIYGNTTITLHRPRPWHCINHLVWPYHYFLSGFAPARRNKMWCSQSDGEGGNQMKRVIWPNTTISLT